MHDEVLNWIASNTKEADVIPEGFELKTDFIKQCAKDSNNSVAVVEKAVNALIAQKTIEVKNVKTAGVEGFRDSKVYIKKVESKEEK